MVSNSFNNAYIIGQTNFNNWSQGLNQKEYLRVLPHPDQKVIFKDPFLDWQKDHQNGQFKEESLTGNYFSSWGPDKELNVTLKMSDLSKTVIDGFGILKSGDGLIPWLKDSKGQPEKTPYEFLRGYNGQIPGPMLITEPGDTLKIKLENDLKEVTNLHTHGLHVSPLGDGDNVLISLKPGETRDIDIPIPDNHFIGVDWYHPHLHGEVADQVGSGLGGLLAINAPYNIPDLDNFNPTTSPIYTFAINTFGIQQELRNPSPTDPLNQSPDSTVKVPAGTPLQVLGEEDGKKIYELSDAVFEGYNAKPALYDPQKPTGNPPSFTYGGGGLAEPVENVIHTANGQYNPTLDLKTGEWDLFTFANMSTNAFHVVQLVYDDGTQLIPQEVNLVAIDGDAAGVVEDVRRQVKDFPILNPGARVSVQHWFDKPGKYYFLSNGTEEILGDNVSNLIKGKKGFNDGHLIWGSQVLATVEVTGDPVTQGEFPKPYETLVQQSQKINELVTAAEEGKFDRERDFVWDANPGGAILIGNNPTDTNVKTFEGTYTINGKYFSTTPGESLPPLAMPMLGTTEIWNVINKSGLPNPDLDGKTIPGTNIPVPNFPLPEWHPFHIHQNDFTVLSINGFSVDEIEDNYLARVLSDTIALPPAYVEGTATKENPYGRPADPTKPEELAKLKASVVRILMKFEDFPGSYVNHCHILFHEDAGMMMVLRPILNTKDTLLGLSSEDGSGQIDLFRASNQQGFSLTPYGTGFKKGIDVAIADVNYKGQKDAENKNVTDNVTDVITIQRSLDKASDKFAVKVFDGKILLDAQTDKNPLITQFTPFQDIASSPNQIASVATGDINGDGFADIAVGLGGGISPTIEIYSGKDYQLLSRLSPFHHENFQGKINLAVGDVDGDNYDDIIVGQGDNGRGLLELYSGQLITQKGSLNGKDTSHETALLSKEFQPYGADYKGEIDVTSGYILQRPDEPNDAPTQTNNANITTIAKGSVPNGKEQIQLFTFLGGGHHHEEEHEGDHDSSMEAEQLRLEVSLTPTGNTQEISGTFADLPGLPKGEPVLFTRKQNGEYGIIHLGDKNKPESTSVTTTKLTKNADNDVFTIDSNTDLSTLKVTLTASDANFVNQLGVFVVDDASGKINGIAPGAADYTEAAIERAKVIFSGLANIPNGFNTDNLTRLLQFNSGENLRFLLVKNSTIDAVLDGVTPATEVLFADPSTQKITDLGADGFSLAWEDGAGNKVNDFQDFVVKIQATKDSLPLGTSLQEKPQGEVIDLRRVTQQVKADFAVNRDAAFNNFIGFYKVADENGGIDTTGDGKADILIGEAGYTQAAVSKRLPGIDLTVNNQGTATYSATFQPGSIFAPFIIVNGKPEAILHSNLNNNPAVYFPFLGANTDKADHISLLANNVFGFEDLPKAGDKDFNDVTVRVDLSLV